MLRDAPVGSYRCGWAGRLTAGCGPCPRRCRGCSGHPRWLNNRASRRVIGPGRHRPARGIVGLDAPRECGFDTACGGPAAAGPTREDSPANTHLSRPATVAGHVSGVAKRALRLKWPADHTLQQDWRLLVVQCAPKTQRPTASRAPSRHWAGSPRCLVPSTTHIRSNHTADITRCGDGPDRSGHACHTGLAFTDALGPPVLARCLQRAAGEVRTRALPGREDCASGEYHIRTGAVPTPRPWTQLVRNPVGARRELVAGRRETSTPKLTRLEPPPEVWGLESPSVAGAGVWTAADADAVPDVD